MELDAYTLNTVSAAKKLGYNVQYVRFLASQGKLPALKRGRQWIFSEAEILNFLKSETNNVLEGNNRGRRKDDEGNSLLQ